MIPPLFVRLTVQRSAAQSVQIHPPLTPIESRLAKSYRSALGIRDGDPETAPRPMTGANSRPSSLPTEGSLMRGLCHRTRPFPQQHATGSRKKFWAQIAARCPSARRESRLIPFIQCALPAGPAWTGEFRRHHDFTRGHQHATLSALGTRRGNAGPLHQRGLCAGSRMPDTWLRPRAPNGDCHAGSSMPDWNRGDARRGASAAALPQMPEETRGV